MFDHEKLDVYHVALEFVVLVNQVVVDWPRGNAYLVDQLQRASSSVSLNIAEGAGEYSSNEKCRFYRIAKRSATECAGIFDICRSLKLVEEGEYLKARQLLLRIVSMLIKMAQKTDNSGTGTGTHTGTVCL